MQGERSHPPGIFPLQSSFNARPGVEQISQSIPNEIKRQHCQHHGSGRKQYQVWRFKQVSALIVKHCPPTGRRRRYAQSKKTHGRFCQDRAGHPNRSLHDHGLNNIRQNVPHDDPQVARSERTRCFDKLFLTGCQHLRTNQPRVSHPTTERQREHEIKNSRPAKSP